MNLTGGSFTNITGLTSPTLANSTSYEVEELIGCQVSAGTQGIQWAVQCSVAGATMMCQYEGSQGTIGGSAGSVNGGLLTSQGVQGYHTCCVAGQGWVKINGIVTAPSSGSATIGIQAKGNQSSATPAILANSFLRLTVA